MTPSANIRAFAAKAARVALVFMLVFWSSLRVEYLVAFGADAAADAITLDDGSAHETDELTDLLIYQWFPNEGDAETGLGRWKPVANALASGEENATVTLTAADPEQKFVAAPVWNGAKPEGYDTGAGLKAVTAAKFVKWESPELIDGDEGCIASEVAAGKNMLVLRASGNGSAKVRCAIDDTRADDLVVSFEALASGFDQEPELGPDSEPPHLGSVDILDKDGNQFEAGKNLVFDDVKDATEPVTYQFKARVTFASQSFGEDDTYESWTDGTLSEFSGGAVEDLRWVVTADKDVARIDENGLLTITGEGEFEVGCSGYVPATLEEMPSDRVTVIAGKSDAKEDDPQGASHPAESLRITATLPQSASNSDAPETPEAPDTSETPDDQDAGEGGEEPAAGDGESPENGGSADEGQESAEGEFQEQAEGGAGALDRVYSLEELQARSGDAPQLFKMSAGGQQVSITGQGFSLVDLLRDTFSDEGLDLDSLPVDKVTFRTYERDVSVSWDFLKDPNVNSLMAVKSYVHQADDAADTAVGADKLVDNARFRLLFDHASSLTGSSSDADDFRWIKAVDVSFKTTDSDRLAVGISYTPVPQGVNAEFVAVPNHNISGSWNCKWEVSEDGQTGWSVLEGRNGQTLSIPTDSSTIGTWYRVTIDNETSAAEGEEELTATSEPVQLEEGAGVVLSYTPPEAGGMAIFRTQLYGYDSSKVEKYVWEASIDGGITWDYGRERLKTEANPTLRLPTKSPSESAGSGEGDGSGEGSGTAPLIYIRVRVITPEAENPLVSNVQPLTVHTGEGGGGSSDDGREDGEDGPAGGKTDPSSPSTPATPPSGGGAGAPAGTSAPTEVTIAMDGYPASAFNPEGDQTTPSTSASASAPAQLYINDVVTDQILEQEEAREATMEASTNGARWTKLNTVNPTGDDVRTVLADNPLAPFVVPVGLGTLAAGGVEKLLSFRRQL